ncbi:MAG: hypothetical protein OXR66_06520 [Candidatus Woesearchaeota archaeon]|nr:hypothetical protein [Candidatus Woesearchaeota archaeon]
MQKILHYPRLDTILNVERLLKNAAEPLSKNEIDRRLEKKIMRPTLNVILNYLEESGKIALLKEGILWIYEKDVSKKLRAKLDNAALKENIK